MRGLQTITTPDRHLGSGIDDGPAPSVGSPAYADVHAGAPSGAGFTPLQSRATGEPGFRMPARTSAAQPMIGPRPSSACITCG